MAVFEINGKPYNNFDKALEAIRTIWSEYKAPAVEEQIKEALSEPSLLDIERAARGVPAPELSQREAATAMERRNAALEREREQAANN